MKASKMIAKARAKRLALAVARDTTSVQCESVYRESLVPPKHKTRTRNYTTREREQQQETYNQDSHHVAVQRIITARNLRPKFHGDVEGKHSIGL
jgi:hypothetical protein